MKPSRLREICSTWSLYYYGLRYYNSAQGKWLSRDPIAEQGGLNLYGFVRNNGVNDFDILGLESYMPPPGTSGGMTHGGSAHWEETGRRNEHTGGDLETTWTRGTLYEQVDDDCIKTFVKQQWMRRYDDYKEIVTYTLTGAGVAGYVLGKVFSWLPGIPVGTKTEEQALPRKY